MRITSFHKALMGTAAVTSLVGGTTAVLLLRGNRKDAEDQAYRATDMPVGEFVDRVLSDYDQGTYVTPLTETYSESYESDGVLTIGAEDNPVYDATLFREFQDAPNGYDELISGQRFLVAADGDEDGHVTRRELRSAVEDVAGSDGALSADERREVLVDKGLAEVVAGGANQPRTSWESNQDYERPVVAVAEVVADMIRDYRAYRDDEDAGIKDGALVIDQVRPSIPWLPGERDQQLGSGEIRSMLPTLTAIDEGAHGDGDGEVSRTELAHWVADEYRSSRLSYGHVTVTGQEALERLHGQVLGRIDADTLQGHAYLSTKVPAADVANYYGGDLGGYLDSIKGVRQARGPVDWAPDPAKGGDQASTGGHPARG